MWNWYTRTFIFARLRGRLSWNYNLLKHHIVLFFLYEFFLGTVSHKGFNEAILIQEYMSYLLFSPIGVFKGDIQDILDVISSVFPTRVFKKVSRILCLLIFFPLGFGGGYSNMIHRSCYWSPNLFMIFPFQGFLVWVCDETIIYKEFLWHINTKFGFSSDFSHRVFGVFPYNNQGWLNKDYMKHTRS